MIDPEVDSWWKDWQLRDDNPELYIKDIIDKKWTKAGSGSGRDKICKSQQNPEDPDGACYLFPGCEDIVHCKNLHTRYAKSIEATIRRADRRGDRMVARYDRKMRRLHNRRARKKFRADRALAREEKKACLKANKGNKDEKKACGMNLKKKLLI